MKRLTVQQVADLSGGRVVQGDPDSMVTAVRPIPGAFRLGRSLSLW